MVSYGYRQKKQCLQKGYIQMGFTAFLDFEFTQGPRFPKEEIISVGCVFYDDGLNEIDSFYSLVKPSINRKISSRVADITKISQKDIDNAPNFYNVMNSFIKKTKKYPGVRFYSWGTDDWKVFKNECSVNKCIWMRKHITQITNLQIEIFNSIRDGNKKLFHTPRNLTLTSLFYNVNQLEAHNALNDAKMLAEIYKAKKLRGNYDYNKRKFTNMDAVSGPSMFAANRIADEVKTKEKRGMFNRMKNKFGSGTMEKILDGNLYHLIEPMLDEPLFAKKKHRNYSDYTVQIFLDDNNLGLFVKISSLNKEIKKILDVEKQNALILSILHIFSKKL